MRQVVGASSTINDLRISRTFTTRFAEAQIQDLGREGASRSLHSQHSELASPVPHTGTVVPVKPHSDSMPTTAPGANPPPTSSIAPRASLPPTRKPRRRRQKAAKEKLYAIRGILREEYRGGELWYEIDWDNDPDTGQQYPPSWEPAGNATSAAVEEWETRNKGVEASPSSPTSSPDSHETEDEVLSLDPKTKRRLGETHTELEDPRPSKRLREHSADQPTGAVDRASGPPAPLGLATFAVELQAPRDLNPSEYLPVSSLSGFSSQTQEDGNSSQNSQNLVFDSQRTIPDSQELTGSAVSQVLVDNYLESAELLEDANCPDKSQSREPVSSPIAPGLPLPESGINQNIPSANNGSDQAESLTEDIPSRQPDTQRGLIDQSLGALDEAPRTSDESSSCLNKALEPRRPSCVENPSSPHSEESLLLTGQLTFETPETTRSVSVPSEGEEQTPTSPHRDPGVSSSPILGSASSPSPQSGAGSHPYSAQLVSGPSDHPDDLYTLSGDSAIQPGDKPVSRDGSVPQDKTVAPGTRVGTSENAESVSESQSSSVSQPLSESDGNRGATNKKTSSSQLSGRCSLLRQPLEPSENYDEANTWPSNEKDGKGYQQHSRDEHSRHWVANEPLSPQNPREPTALPPRGNTAAAMELPPAEEQPVAAAETFALLDTNLSIDAENLLPVLPTSEQGLVSPSAALPADNIEPLASIEGVIEHQGVADLLANPAPDPNSTSISFEEELDPSTSLSRISAVEQLKMALRMSPLDESEPEYDENRTIAPADLSTPFGIDMSGSNGALLSHDAIPVEKLVEDVLATAEPYSPAEGDVEPHAAHASHTAYFKPDPSEREFVVTLPIANNMRHVYLDVIRRNKAIMTAFGGLFGSEAPQSPPETLVANLDQVFEELYDLCDLPSFAESLPTMTPEEMRKHATGTSSKFSFFYEFLEQIRDTSLRVLIVSKPGRAFLYLDALLSSSGFNYSHLGAEPSHVDDEEALSVVLATSDMSIPPLPEVDVLINFDHTARSVRVDNATCVLFLVVAGSLEHIDLKLSDEMDPMERRNALNYATVAARELIDEPDREQPQPHEAALVFAQFVKWPENGIVWDSQELPPETFDFWLSSQPSMQETQQGPALVVDISTRSSSRKRQLDGEAESGPSKRARRLEELSLRHPPQLSDLAKSTLESHTPSSRESDHFIEVGVDQLEAMAAKISEQEERLRAKDNLQATLEGLTRQLEAQLQSHERTTRKIAHKYYEALSERGVFELQTTKALKDTQVAEKRLQEARVQTASLKERIADLQQKLADANTALTTSTAPEVVRSGEMAQELDQARLKIQSLEKKVTIAQNETQYSRQAYQDASNRTGELGQENAALTREISDLRSRANDNILKINSIQADTQRKEDHRIIEEQRSIIVDRERELERVREELRVLRNGRRETRQSSVPRSPRMGVMSPRIGRGTGASSRGTSPAPGEGAAAPIPGMNFLNTTQTNGRWGHLRS